MLCQSSNFIAACVELKKCLQDRKFRSCARELSAVAIVKIKLQSGVSVLQVLYLCVFIKSVIIIRHSIFFQFSKLRVILTKFGFM